MTGVGRDISVGTDTPYSLHGPEIKSRYGASCFALVQTVSGSHRTSCNTSTFVVFRNVSVFNISLVFVSNIKDAKLKKNTFDGASSPYHRILLEYRIVVHVTRNKLYSDEEIFSSSSPARDRIVPTGTGTKTRSNNTSRF